MDIPGVPGSGNQGDSATGSHRYLLYKTGRQSKSTPQNRNKHKEAVKIGRERNMPQVKEQKKSSEKAKWNGGKQSTVI